MKRMSNREFIQRTVYKSHLILMIISVLVVVISLTKCPYAVRHVQVDETQARLVVNRVNEPQQVKPGDLSKEKSNDKNIRHNVKPEKKIKEPKKNKPDPVGEFWAWWLLGVVSIVFGALSIVFYDFFLLEGYAGAGYFLGGAILCGIVFIFILIKLIKLGKKLPHKKKVRADTHS